MQQKKKVESTLFILKLTYQFLKKVKKESWEKILEYSDKNKNPSIDRDRLLKHFLKYMELKINLRKVKEKIFIVHEIKENENNSNIENENVGNNNEIIINKESDNNNIINEEKENLNQISNSQNNGKIYIYI